MIHTKEPWKVEQDTLVVTNEGPVVICEAMEPQDAARIVACVNACDGIPDDVLAGALHYGVDPLQKRIADLEMFLRDDMKDALIDLKNYIDNNHWTRSQQAEHDDCVRMIERLEKLCATT